MPVLQSVSLSELHFRKILAVIGRLLAGIDVRDSFSREISYLRMSVTRRCGFACIYCADRKCRSVPDDELKPSEIFRIAGVLAGAGCHKVRLTGGEPLLRGDIAEICRGIRDLPGVRELALTTSGLYLSGMARELFEAGVSRVNISIDTLDPVKFEMITGKNCLRKVLTGLEAALSSGFEQVKINTVLLRGINDDAASIRALADLADRHSLDLRFIELMPAGAADFPYGEHFTPGSTVLKALPELMEIPEGAGSSGVARMYRREGRPGRIGIISPITGKFCQNCNRIRVLSDGRLRTCLLGGEEFNLRKLSEPEIAEVFRKACALRPKEHGISAGSTGFRIPMQGIGG